MSQYTTDQIAERLGIERSTAYALVTYLRAGGALEDLGATKTPGQKGKGPNVYRVHSENLKHALAQIQSLEEPK